MNLVSKKDTMGLLLMAMVCCTSMAMEQEFHRGGNRRLLAASSSGKSKKDNSLCPDIPERFGCICDGNKGRTVVNCMNQGLTTIPTGLPKHVRDLHLDNNKIQRITANDFMGMTKLERLYLESNHIKFTDVWAFKELYSLKILKLSNNSIARIGSDMFRHLPALGHLFLDNNLISSISWDAFSSLPKLSEVRLKNNPLKCDCSLKKFRDWLNTYRGPGRHNLFLLNAVCEGLDQNFLDIDDNMFGSCDGDQSSLEEDLNCFTCQGERTNEQCTVSQEQCDPQKASCLSTLTVTEGEITMDKTCHNYSECLLKEQNNTDQCLGAGPNMVCHYCCQANLCNYDDFGDKLEYYSYELTFKMEGVFPPSLKDMQSTDAQSKTLIVTERLKESLRGLNASFHVEIYEYREPNITAIVGLEAMVLKELGRNVIDMWHLVNTALVHSVASGPLLHVKAGKNTIELDSFDLCEPEMTRSKKGKFEWNISLPKKKKVPTATLR